jgi:hypothetical protein
MAFRDGCQSEDIRAKVAAGKPFVEVARMCVRAVVLRRANRKEKKMIAPFWDAARKWHRLDRLSIAYMCVLGATAFAPSAAFAACSPSSGNNVTVTCTGTVTNQGPGAGTGYGDSTQDGLALTVQFGDRYGHRHRCEQ